MQQLSISGLQEKFFLSTQQKHVWELFGPAQPRAQPISGQET